MTSSDFWQIFPSITFCNPFFCTWKQEEDTQLVHCCCFLSDFQVHAATWLFISAFFSSSLDSQVSHTFNLYLQSYRSLLQDEQHMFSFFLQEFTASLLSLKYQWRLEIQFQFHVCTTKNTSTMWNICVMEIFTTPAHMQLRQTSRVQKSFWSLMTKD